MSHLFVSDLHLDGAQPSTLEQFVGFLRGPARAARSLHILGDLFEYWLGDDLLDAAKALVCDELRALSKAGVPLCLMRGNRDFLFDEALARRLGALLLPDPALIVLDGVRTLLTHGDLLCTDDPSYQQLRSLTQDSHWRAGLRSLPRAARERLAAMARSGSRRHMARTRPSIMDVSPQTVQNVLAATGAERLIHGHTHRPGMHELRVGERACSRIVLDAWYDGGQYLAIDGARVESRRLRPAAPNGIETADPAR